MEKSIYILLTGIVWAVSSIESPWQPRRQAFYAAKNRALQNFANNFKTALSPVICGRECSLDENCKSFNFIDFDKLCELNNASRLEHPKYFCETQGSMYFDANLNTTQFSLAERVHETCKSLLGSGFDHSSGVNTIYTDGIVNGLLVYCDMETDGGGWIVFQRRQDGSEDFYRNWAEYKLGFGNLSGEFWLGNDNLVNLTSGGLQGTWELRVDLEDWDGNKAWAKYENFAISQEEYTLSLGPYDETSNAGDGLAIHRGRPFTTKDRDNDAWPGGQSAQRYKGAWWFNFYLNSHLNGIYYPDENADTDRGIEWNLWKGVYSLKRCSMKIREICS